MGWRRAVELGCVVLALGFAPRAPAATPAEIGQWSAETPWPNTDTHSHLLPTGKVLTWGEYDEGPLVKLWDPQTNAFSDPPPPPYNIFCAGESFLPDGTLLVTGGHDMAHVGVPYAATYDPWTNAWKQLANMNDNRWYPTTVTLPDGRGFTDSGETDAAGTSDGLPQIWDPATGAWDDLTNAVLKLPYYPRMFVAPNGLLFLAGPDPLSRWLDPAGQGAWVKGPPMVNPLTRDYGSAVMYEPGKILIAGGDDPPTATAEVIDLDEPVPTWRSTASMHYPRRQQNATLLPDGRVLVTGGSSGATFDDKTNPVLPAEVWDPATGQWTEWASQASYHGYHSTATLLPDGRVQMGGGRYNHLSQIFSPPYLFKGPRPTLTGAPDSVKPGETFHLDTPDAAAVRQVTLVRLTTVTHAYNMNQRFNRLTFTRSPSGGLDVVAPADNNQVPPGHYLLFLIDHEGVPSLGRFLRVDTAADPFSHPIVFSDSWRYDDTRVDRGTAWLATHYDDSGWKTGRGQLGHAEGDEATVTDNPSTLYLRKQIRVLGPVTSANLDVLLGDGAAVWINGTQVFAQNMDNGTAFKVFASAVAQDQLVHAEVPASVFVDGLNTVAVEVKHASQNPAVSFALALNVEAATVCSGSCADPGTPDGGACSSDAECPAGDACVAGVCGAHVSTPGPDGGTPSTPGPQGSGPQGVAPSPGHASGCDATGGGAVAGLWIVLAAFGFWRSRASARARALRPSFAVVRRRRAPRRPTR